MSRDSNAERANRAQAALTFYKGSQLKESGEVDRDTLTDLLTDLRHYTANSDETFDDLVLLSADHFHAERRGDE